MENFPGNTHKAGPAGSHSNPMGPAPKVTEPKNVQPVITGKVIERKKPLGRRFKEVFFKGEAKSAAQYVLRDVLLPALKNMIVDGATEGIKRTVYGDRAPQGRYGGTTSRISYGSAYSSPIDRFSQRPRSVSMPDQPPRYVANRRQDSMEIILTSREEAEVVLERLTDLVDKYGVASVADLRDLLGQPNTYVDNKWGWNDLKYSDIRQVREGYLLDLPPVEAL